jgi:uncharacterized protein
VTPTTRDTLPPAIHEMVRKIAARFEPERIVLFGSYARGTAGPNSDADLLVVMHVEGRKRPVVVEMYRELQDVGLAHDIVLVTPPEFDKRSQEPWSLVHNAMREGRVLYDRTKRLV